MPRALRLALRVAMAAPLVAALALSGALPVAARPADLRPVSPSMVVVALSAMPDGTDPLVTDDQYSADIEALLYDPLYYATPSLSYAPDLAASWQVGRRGRSYTYVLNPKARWTNGRPVDAADVVASLQAYASAKDTGRNRAAFGDLLTVRALAPDRVLVRLRRPDAAWMGTLAGLPILPAGRLVSGAQTGKSRTPPSPTDGPYTLRRWDAQGGVIDLAANAAYFRGAPHVGRIEVRVVPSPSSALAELRRGTLQVAILPPAWAAGLTRSAGLATHVVDTLGMTLIAFNVAAAPLRQGAVRRALTAAVNRAALIRQVGVAGVVPVGPWPAALASVPATPAPFDPSGARQLLSRAGWRLEPGGVRMRHGQLLALTLSYPAGSPTLARAMTIVARSWRAVGVAVRVVAEPWTAVRSSAAAGRYQAVAMGLAFGVGAPLASLVGGRGEEPPAGQDVARYHNALVNALLAASGQSANEAAPPAASLAALALALQADPPYLALWSDTGLVVTSATLAGFQANPAGPDIYQPQTWILP